jgi:hypothetical protein
MSKAIIDLSNDILNDNFTKYSKQDTNEMLRVALNELCGSADGKFNPKKYRKNKDEIFEIIEEVVDTRLEEGIKDQFDQFVDYRSTAFGDKLSFKSESDELFEVAKIAGGTNNLRRQAIGSGESYQIDTDWEGVKIYEELERFLAGYVDWVKLIDKVERSFQVKIAEKIFLTIKLAYNAVEAPYKHAGPWSMVEFNKIVDHVEAATGLTPMVIGTRSAIRKVVPEYISEQMKGERNNKGYFQTIDGITFGIIPQAHKIGTDEFAIEDFLLILPNGDEKIVKFVMEGAALIKEVNDQTNADDTQEYVLRKKYGVAVERSAKFGVYLPQ